MDTRYDNSDVSLYNQQAGSLGHGQTPHWNIPPQLPYEPTQPYGQPVFASPLPAHEIDAPFLRLWKLSIGAAIGGLVTGSFFSNLISSVPEALSFSSIEQLVAVGTVLMIIALVFVVISIYYALAIYPSLFGPAPKMQSSAAASFLNCFFGGIIFGLLWNYNIGKGKIGISYKVYAITGVIAIVLAIVIMLFMFAHL
ncbi:MAG: hypothetical protein FWE41_03875 [Coriobacteriia bacterium]|nr:hypothetical protein [Coriobacteriia bacterium]MCL2750481.1 hypothetical protein [Coriobacteriia bacterium]